MLSFRRGDSFFFKFTRRTTKDEIIMTKSQKMWFTVKLTSNSSKNLIQKTLENGINFTDDGYYHIEIKPMDTKELSYGDYVYDIQIENDGIVKTLKFGTLKLEEEVTFEGGE